MLLTHIEEIEARRTALGFTKGDGSKGKPGKQSGKTLAQHHADLAELILIPHPSGQGSNFAPKELAPRICYRIAR